MAAPVVDYYGLRGINSIKAVAGVARKRRTLSQGGKRAEMVEGALVEENKQK
jgi:hypothetical protein